MELPSQVEPLPSEMTENENITQKYKETTKVSIHLGLTLLGPEAGILSWYIDNLAI